MQEKWTWIVGSEPFEFLLFRASWLVQTRINYENGALCSQSLPFFLCTGSQQGSHKVDGWGTQKCPFCF